MTTRPGARCDRRAGLGDLHRAAAAGARLTLSARTPDRLDALAERLGTAAVDRQPADLRDPDAPRRVVEAAAGQGGLDGVVNAAGVVAFGRIDELDDDVLDELMLLNLIAPIRLARAALPRLDRGAFLVNISAVVARLGHVEPAGVTQRWVTRSTSSGNPPDPPGSPARPRPAGRRPGWTRRPGPGGPPPRLPGPCRTR